MTPPVRRIHSAVAVAAIVVIGGVALSACGLAHDVQAVRKVAGDIRGNKATIDAFSTKLQSSATTSFAATYVTTGGSPTTVVYAVKPPTGVAFVNAPDGKNDGPGAFSVFVNADGEYECSPSTTARPGASSGASCQKLGTASSATENALFTFYTPAHWVTFLRDFALAAGIAGDKVTTSTRTVNGFSLSCVDFEAPGVPGTSTICTTSQGILGYVKVAADSTSFEISHYTSSPPAALFQLPTGASVTTDTVPSS
ncbi:MAG TPA: hypothetical protein VHV57_06595 [Acidimicrobiales bacterium]|jgi:hypothetical protein|nr:hypothetical protein [Acidimicrobiales bacterium]